VQVVKALDEWLRQVGEASWCPGTGGSPSSSCYTKKGAAIFRRARGFSFGPAEERESVAIGLRWR
jgi:hypothetical protein